MPMGSSHVRTDSALKVAARVRASAALTDGLFVRASRKSDSINPLSTATTFVAVVSSVADAENQKPSADNPNKSENLLITSQTTDQLNETKNAPANYAGAHYGRDEPMLREDTSNPVGKLGLSSGPKSNRENCKQPRPDARDCRERLRSSSPPPPRQYRGWLSAS